jgi:hypothetical protein
MVIDPRRSAVSSTLTCKKKKAGACKLLQTARVPNLIWKRARDRESFNGRRLAAQTDREFYGTSDRFPPTLQNPPNPRCPKRRGGR